MSFNLGVTLAAIAVGLFAGGVGGYRDLGLAPIQLIATAAAGLFGSAIALVFTSAVTDGDLFAVAHMAYLIVAISIPIASVVMIVRSRRAPIGGKLLLSVGLIPGLLGLYATHVEPFWLRVDEARVGAIPQAAGLRVGVFSDLQTDEIGDYENEAVDTLLAQDPDIILIPGDFWQMSADEFEERFDSFAAIMRRLDEGAEHVIAVDGNTDSVTGLRRLTAGTNVMVLDDETTDIAVGDIDIRIGGISLNGVVEERNAVMADLAAADPTTVVLLLAHKPDIVYGIPSSARVDLVIAGHTHGGQISLPFIGPIATLTTVPRDAAAGGLSRVNAQNLYISTGVGREKHRAPQVRFGVRPSVGILEFFDRSAS